MIYRSDKLLMIFARNPMEGKVKTRLAQSVGEIKALEVYHQLLEHTNSITNSLSCDKVVYYDSFIDREDMWKNYRYYKNIQLGNDLGDKMLNAFEKGFNESYQSIVIIGSDCLELSSEIIMDAFNALKSNDVVVGPARDGGYYLLGMNKLYAEFFLNKQWSTSSVFNDTLEDIQRNQLKLTLLPILSDIDKVDDLNQFVAQLG